MKVKILLSRSNSNFKVLIFSKNKISNIRYNQYMNLKSQMSDNFEQNSDEEPAKQNRIFMYDQFNVKYLNTSQIIYTRSEFGSDVKVDNFLCYQEGNVLSKITKISYEDKVVMIEDKFEVCTPAASEQAQNGNCVQQTFKVPKSAEKIRILPKNHEQKPEKLTKTDKKDKKNIVKNIIKIFNSWLEKKKVEKQNYKYQGAISQLRKLISQENYNNRLLKKIMNNIDINEYFLQFLIDDAEEEIKYSRIHDKQSHYQALQVYKKLLDHSIKNPGKTKKALNQASENQEQSPRVNDQSEQLDALNQNIISKGQFDKNVEEKA